MAQQKQLIALILCICMMLTAGCTGWGTDGPASPETDEWDTILKDALE